MGLARAFGVTLVGVEGHVVRVEADLSPGLPGFVLVGLPDTALTEARDRVRAAVVNSGAPWPEHRITVSLSPASLPKRGSHFDLPIALSVLAAAGAVPRETLEDVVVLGELGLDGRVRGVRGVLPAVLAAAAAGVRTVVVPAANAEEAALVPGVEVLGAVTLRALLARLCGEQPDAEALPPDPGPPTGAPAGVTGPPPPPKDLADVLGQPEGRHALEVCAAGGHNLFLLGPPGAGKTMLAERLPGLLPDLEHPAALEVSAVHSVAGTLPAGTPLVRRPPYQDPHHTATQAAVVGGGAGVPRPGAVSLAHRGVLFLDEAPEFGRHVLDALREPLESGEVMVSRSGGTARYPARFLLVMAANPCPCGRSGDPSASCTCAPFTRTRYLARLSGPLMDRMDVRVDVGPVDRATLLADRSFVEGSAAVADRVRAARERAAARFTGTPWTTVSEVPGPELRRRWPVPNGAAARLEQFVERGRLSARGVDRLLRVAWTLADLADRDAPGSDDVSAALTLRLAGATPA